MEDGIIKSDYIAIVMLEIGVFGIGTSTMEESL